MWQFTVSVTVISLESYIYATIFNDSLRYDTELQVNNNFFNNLVN